MDVVSASAWKNSVNGVIGGVWILLSPCAAKSLYSMEKIQRRIMVTTFDGNPSKKIISSYSPTNACDETDLDIFYNELSSFVRSVHKYDVLIIERDMNAQFGKNVNNKFSLRHSSNRNGEHPTDFILKNRLTCLDTKFQKKKRKLWK